jgi:hypothetical protein
MNALLNCVELARGGGELRLYGRHCAQQILRPFLEVSLKLDEF